MQKHSLTVAKREVNGKKVRHLRKKGLLPANIYGKAIESVAVQVGLKEFEHTFKETGETGLIELHLDGQKRPVLIHNVQLDYLTQEPIHADFYQVNLKEKIKTMIPVVLVGEAQAVAEKLGMLLHTLNEIEVEALPGNLPENFEVDVTKLATLNDQITVGDLQTGEGVEILTDPTQVVAKISELVTQEEPEPVVTAAEGEETTAEGETPPAEQTEASSEEAK
jgi:large subunit ribosomal protein L25